MKLIFESNLNILLSELLNQMGVISHAEQLGRGRRDIVIYHQGLEIVLEGSYYQTDAEEDAARRIEQLSCDIAVAICYPRTFMQELTEKEIKEKLKTINYKTKIITPEDISGTLYQFLYNKKIIAKPEPIWQELSLGSLGTIIREVGQFIINEKHIVETQQYTVKGGS